MTEPELYWEDFPVGEVLTFGAYEVTKEELIEFASEYDPQPFHLDEEIAKKSLLGGLATSGWHSCAMLMRMMCDEFMNRAAGLGSPGIDEVRWKRPVYVGDVLSVKRTTLEARRSKSRPDMGLVKFISELSDQKGEVKMTSEGWIMFACRTPAPAGAEG